MDLDARMFKYTTQDGRLRAILYIPGMEVKLALPIDNGPQPCWVFQGNEYKPTFIPSIFTEYRWGDIKIRRNHVIVRDGIITYLPDCTHEYAGRTIPLPRLREWPDWAKYW